jgi:hypothetical protein
LNGIEFLREYFDEESAPLTKNVAWRGLQDRAADVYF